MRVEDEIKQSLQQAFNPSELSVIDESERHRGHVGYREGGQTHFRVRIRSQEFCGQSRLARQRAVHEALGAQMLAHIHALTLDIDT